jgi:hypothetical protein
MNCEEFERKLVNLLYKKDYCGHISLVELKSIFSYINQGELDKCIRWLIKSNRGWEVKYGYLINKQVAREILNEIRRIERDMKAIEDNLRMLKKEVEIVEQVRRIWLDNTGLEDDRLTKIRIYAYVFWTDILNTLFDEIRKNEKEYRNYKDLIEEIKLKVESTFMEEREEH